MKRSLPLLLLALAAMIGFARPRTLSGQSPLPKALVYCPVAIDEAGCNRIVAALTAFQVDRAYDGRATSGGFPTVDLRTADLSGYSLFFVPALANVRVDGVTRAPYLLLNQNQQVKDNLIWYLSGRSVVWTGAPDNAATPEKTRLLQNLAAHAQAGPGEGSMGLVFLLDASTLTSKYNFWLGDISNGLSVTPCDRPWQDYLLDIVPPCDPRPGFQTPGLNIYDEVLALNAFGTALLDGVANHPAMAMEGIARHLGDEAQGWTGHVVGQYRDGTGQVLNGSQVSLSWRLLGSNINVAPAELSPPIGASWSFTATLRRADGTPISGVTVNFRLNGVSYGRATNSSGQTTLASTDLAAPLASGTYNVDVRYRGSVPANRAGSNARARLIISTAPTPTTLTVDPASASFGGTTRLSATLTAAGVGVAGKSIAFTLNGASVGSGTTDASGVAFVDGVSLSGIGVGTLASGVGASFAGDDTYRPSSGTSALTLTEAPATVTIVPASLSHTYDGSPKSAVATTNPAGLAVSITYNGAATPPTNAGQYAVVATITDPNYTAPNATGTLVIGVAAATMTLSNLDQTYDGTPKPVTVTTTPAGLTGVSVTYNGSATPPTAAGSYSVVASLTNANYAAPNVTGILEISTATPIVIWNTPGAITYGTPLGATQLNAIASVPGTFVYTPAAGTVLNAGIGQLLRVEFTPTDPSYLPVTTMVQITVNKAVATLTLGNLNHVYDGTPKSATVTTTPDGLTGVLVNYNGVATPPTAAGSYNVVASLTNANYTAPNATGTLVISAALPVVTWDNPADIVFGTPLSSTQLNATASVPGTFVYTPAAGTVLNAGTGQQLRVVFTPTDPSYSSVTRTVQINVTRAPATITLSNLDQTYNGSPRSATVTTTPAGLQGVSVSYNGALPPTNAGSYNVVASLSNPNYTAPNATGTLVINKALATITLGNLNHTYDGTPKLATATTTPAGLSGVSIAYSQGGTPVASPTNAGSYDVVASLTNANYTASNATGTLVIGAGVVTITWNDPADITYGTPLGSAQLNATASVPGTFEYVPAAGTVLNAGPAQLLRANFTPTNTSYAPASKTVQINVTKASATLALFDLSQTYNGSPRSATVTTTPADLSGASITYSGSATAPTDAGSYDVVASLDNANYTAPNATGVLVIDKAAATLALGNLNHTYDGTPKSANVTTSPAGLTGVSITYNGSPTPPTVAGSYSVVASLTNANYAAPNATGTLEISAVATAIAWDDPADITYGTPLGSAQLNATATVAGTFVYTPAAGTILNVGAAQALRADFTPSDPSYTSASKTVHINVTRATATLALSNLEQTYDGTARSATVTTTPAGLTGVSVTYDGSSTPPVAVGSYSVVASLDNANYTASNATGTLIVGKATATVILADLEHFYDGTEKPATATTEPAGLSVTISYATGGQTTIAPTNAGTYPVVATVDDLSYEGSATGTLVIHQAVPTILWGMPADIVHGTALGAEQLNASSPVPGSFVYSPPAGTILDVGDGQPLHVAFTPTDPNYTSAIATVQINVMAKENQTITFDALGDKTFGDEPFVVSASASSGLSVSFAVQAGSTCSVAGSTVTITGAGSCTVVASQPGSPTYNAAVDVERSFTVNKATATLTLSELSQTYDGSSKTATVTTAPIGLSGVATTYAGSAVAPTDAGSYAVEATLTHANYTGLATGTLVIGKAALTVRADDKTRGLGVANPPLTGTITGLVGDDDITASYATAADPSSPSGTYPIVPTLNDPNSRLGNYDVTSIDGTLTITGEKLAQTITFDALADKTYGDAPFTVSATASSELVVSFLASGTCTISGSTVTITGAGSCTVTAEQPGNHIYNPAAEARSFVIAKATATITLSNLDQSYDGTPKPVTATTAPAGLTVVSVTYDNSTTAPTAAGSYAVSATLTNQNYMAGTVTGTLVISAGVVAVTWANPADITYGTALGSTQLSATASVPGTFVYTPALGTILNAGSAQSLSVDFTPTDPSYAPASRTVQINVMKAPATIALSDLNQGYTGTARVATAITSPTGLTGVSITYEGSATAPTDAGSYDVVASLDNANYTAPNATGVLVIDKAGATITLGNLSHTYDGTAKPASATTTPTGLSGISVTYDGSTTAPTAAGSYSVVASLTNANYTAPNATGTLVIGVGAVVLAWDNPADIAFGTPLSSSQLNATASVPGSFIYRPTLGTVLNGGQAQQLTVDFTPTDPSYAPASKTVLISVTPAGQTVTFAALPAKTYGDAPFTVSATASSGLAPTFSTTGPCTVAGSTVTITGAGSCTVTAHQAGNGNYAPAADVARSFAIAKAATTLTWSDPAGITYGTALGATQLNATRSVPGTITYSPAAGTVLDAGDGQLLSATLTPDDQQNYLSATATVTISVTKAALTVTADDAARLVGAANPTFTGTLLGVRAGDGITAEYTTEATTASPAGTYPIVPRLLDPAHRLGNYSVTPINGTLTIRKALQSITFGALAGQTYGNAPFTVAATSSSGLPVSFTAAGPCTVSGTTVSITGSGSCAVTANQAGNGTYEAATSVTQRFHIAKAALLVRADDKSRDFGQPNPTLTGTITGIQYTDNLSAQYTTTATTSSPAGPYAIVPVLVDPDGRATNYDVTLENGTLTVIAVNRAPVLDPIASQTKNEGTLVSFTATANDLDGNTLTYSLVGAPEGASINGATGAFAWTPTEAQGPGTFTFTVKVQDDGTPTTLADSKSVTITVNEMNVAPVLDPIGAKSVVFGNSLTFKATATDADLPANTLTFSLVNAPTGATIGGTSGDFSWTPNDTQQPGTYTFTVRVSDGALNDDETITVTVQSPPRLTVGLDMVPGSSTNTIGYSSSSTEITFAILSSATFDARQVDPATVTLGDEKGTDTPLAKKSDGTYKFVMTDVNGDFRPDFYGYVNKALLKQNGDLTLTTTSMTALAGLKPPSTQLIRGTGMVKVIP